MSAPLLHAPRWRGLQIVELAGDQNLQRKTAERSVARADGPDARMTWTDDRGMAVARRLLQNIRQLRLA